MKIHNQKHALPFKKYPKITQKSNNSYLTVVTPSSTYFLLHMLFFLALASQNYGRQAKGIKIS